MLEYRVFSGKVLVALEMQRFDPVRVALVEAARETDKGRHIRLADNRSDLDCSFDPGSKLVHMKAFGLVS